jgi:peptidoglycan/xylan/chitin deacetylase (PgdA/CDA1 family)
MDPRRERLVLSISPAHRKASRWVSVFLLVLLGVVVLSVPSNAADSPVESASVTQENASLVLEAELKEPFTPRPLDRQPDLADPTASYLCFELTPESGDDSKRVCVGGSQGFTDTVGVSDQVAEGTTAEREVSAKVRFPVPGKVRAVVPTAAIGLEPGTYSWGIEFSKGTCGQEEDCSGTFSSDGESFELAQALPVGCSGGKGEVVRRASGADSQVALTFDDGPGSFSEGAVEALKRHGARGTFFPVGQLVRTDPETLRGIIEAGNELGNHSDDHSQLPDKDNIEAATEAIVEATGFRPCLFRAPYGLTDAAQSETLRKLKLDSILWDVDTNDYSGSSAEMIAETIISEATPGSIVLLHDGGGDRSQLAPALDIAIPELQSRGLELVTVTELLGQKFLYESSDGS